MAIAIITKYLPATETRGARIKVSVPKGFHKSKTYSYDYSANCSHEEAFKQWLEEVNTNMAIKYGEPDWYKLLGKATNHNNTGYIFLIQ